MPQDWAMACSVGRARAVWAHGCCLHGSCPLLPLCLSATHDPQTHRLGEEAQALGSPLGTPVPLQVRPRGRAVVSAEGSQGSLGVESHFWPHGLSLFS